MAKYQYFAQPIENITTKHVIVYELLLRQWQPDSQTWERPATFDLNADTLIDLLTSAIAKLHDNHVSINLTNQQFADPKIIAALTNFVHQHMVPRQLTVELVDAPDLALIKRMSATYRTAGIMLAIDDVGSDNMYADIKELLPYVNTVKFALQNMRKMGEHATQADIDALNFWFNQAEDQ